MSIVFDGVWTGPVVSGGPIISYDIGEIPLEPVTLAVPMMSTVSTYAAPTAGQSTTYAGLTWAALGDSSFINEGAEVWRFVRQWVRKPASLETFETYAATYPGYIFVRDPITASGPSKVEVDFFLIGPAGDYASPGSIPFTDGDEVVYGTGGNAQRAPLASGVYLNNGSVAGGASASSPSITNYQALITADESPSTSYSIQVDPSKITRVIGSLWRRETRSVKAR